jgi:hypothetical protein
MLFTSKFRSSDNRQRRPRFASLRVEVLENRLQPSVGLLGQELELLTSSLDPSWMNQADNPVPVQFQAITPVQHSMPSPSPAPAVSAASGGATARIAVAPPAMPLQSSPLSNPNTAPMGGSAPLALGAAAKNLALSTISASPTTVNRGPALHQLTELQVAAILNDPHLQLTPATIQAVNPQQVHGYASQNWATYVTQTTTEATAQAVTVDNNGNVYVTGATDEGTAKKAFVAEYDPNGNQIFFTTFQAADVLSNPGTVVTYSHSQGNAIALDGNGNIYVVGTATELNAPHYQDAFIMRFDSSGNVDPTYGAGYNSPVGNVSGNGVVVGPDGTATLVGSARLPASDGTGTIHQDIFLAQLAPDGSVPSVDGVPYYFGFGPGGFTFQGAQQFSATSGSAIALSLDGMTAYVSATGSPVGNTTNSQILVLSFSTSAPFSLSGGQFALNGTGQVVGSNDGPATSNGIAVGADGSVYQAGTTSYQENGQTSTYPFVINWAPDLSSVNFSGLDDSQPGGTGTSIAVDPSGNIYLTGTGFDQNGIQRALVDYMQGSGGQLVVSDFTLIAQNGSGQEAGWGIAYSNASDTAFVVGDTTSSNLSTDNTALNGSQDAFLANVGSFMN